MDSYHRYIYFIYELYFYYSVFLSLSIYLSTYIYSLGTWQDERGEGAEDSIETVLCVLWESVYVCVILFSLLDADDWMEGWVLRTHNTHTYPHTHTQCTDTAGHAMRGREDERGESELTDPSTRLPFTLRLRKLWLPFTLRLRKLWLPFTLRLRRLWASVRCDSPQRSRDAHVHIHTYYISIQIYTA